MQERGAKEFFGNFKKLFEFFSKIPLLTFPVYIF